jgi:3'-phosphoadenosine 5'-phosphosulfate (PAPS) 3'-phosphatase
MYAAVNGHSKKTWMFGLAGLPLVAVAPMLAQIPHMIMSSHHPQLPPWIPLSLLALWPLAMVPDVWEFWRENNKDGEIGELLHQPSPGWVGDILLACDVEMEEALTLGRKLFDIGATPSIATPTLQSWRKIMDMWGIHTSPKVVDQVWKDFAARHQPGTRYDVFVVLHGPVANKAHGNTLVIVEHSDIPTIRPTRIRTKEMRAIRESQAAFVNLPIQIRQNQADMDLGDSDLFIDSAKKTAERTVVQAGILLRNFQRAAHLTKRKKEDGSWVSDADIEASHLASRIILNTFPDHYFLSEEWRDGIAGELLRDSDFNNPASKFQWIIDPLDGTRFYLEESEEYAIQLVLMYDGDPIVAAAYFPALVDENGRQGILMSMRLGEAGIEINGSRYAPIDLDKSPISPSDMRVVTVRSQRERPTSNFEGVDKAGFKEVVHSGTMGLVLARLISKRVGYQLPGDHSPVDVVASHLPFTWDFLPGAALIVKVNGVATEYRDGNPIFPFDLIHKSMRRRVSIAMATHQNALLTYYQGEEGEFSKTRYQSLKNQLFPSLFLVFIGFVGLLSIGFSSLWSALGVLTLGPLALAMYPRWGQKEKQKNPREKQEGDFSIELPGPGWTGDVQLASGITLEETIALGKEIYRSYENGQEKLTLAFPTLKMWGLTNITGYLLDVPRIQSAWVDFWGRHTPGITYDVYIVIPSSFVQQVTGKILAIVPHTEKITSRPTIFQKKQISNKGDVNKTDSLGASHTGRWTDVFEEQLRFFFPSTVVVLLIMLLGNLTTPPDPLWLSIWFPSFLGFFLLILLLFPDGNSRSFIRAHFERFKEAGIHLAKYKRYLVGRYWTFYAMSNGLPLLLSPMLHWAFVVNMGVWSLMWISILVAFVLSHLIVITIHVINNTVPVFMWDKRLPASASDAKGIKDWSMEILKAGIPSRHTSFESGNKGLLLARLLSALWDKKRDDKSDEPHLRYLITDTLGSATFQKRFISKMKEGDLFDEDFWNEVSRADLEELIKDAYSIYPLQRRYYEKLISEMFGDSLKETRGASHINRGMVGTAELKNWLLVENILKLGIYWTYPGKTLFVRKNIGTIHDLVRTQKDDFLGIEGIAAGTVHRVTFKLGIMGLKLGMKPDDVTSWQIPVKNLDLIQKLYRLRGTSPNRPRDGRSLPISDDAVKLIASKKDFKSRALEVFKMGLMEFPLGSRNPAILLMKFLHAKARWVEEGEIYPGILKLSDWSGEEMEALNILKGEESWMLGNLTWDQFNRESFIEIVKEVYPISAPNDKSRLYLDLIDILFPVEDKGDTTRSGFSLGLVMGSLALIVGSILMVFNPALLVDIGLVSVAAGGIFLLAAVFPTSGEIEKRGYGPPTTGVIVKDVTQQTDSAQINYFWSVVHLIRQESLSHKDKTHISRFLVDVVGPIEPVTPELNVKKTKSIIQSRLHDQIRVAIESSQKGIAPVAELQNVAYLAGRHNVPRGSTDKALTAFGKALGVSESESENQGKAWQKGQRDQAQLKEESTVVAYYSNEQLRRTQRLTSNTIISFDVGPLLDLNSSTKKTLTHMHLLKRIAGYEQGKRGDILVVHKRDVLLSDEKLENLLKSQILWLVKMNNLSLYQTNSYLRNSVVLVQDGPLLDPETILERGVKMLHLKGLLSSAVAQAYRLGIYTANPNGFDLTGILEKASRFEVFRLLDGFKVLPFLQLHLREAQTTRVVATQA